MTKLRVLVVDDELLARQRLLALLRPEKEVEVIGECADGVEAINAIRRDRPDLVFLDVQMPGCDGLEVVARLTEEERPAVVFVTAHERFAVGAFAVQAIDYLLKPFDQDRLRLALQRVTDHLEGERQRDVTPRLERWLAEAAEPKRLAIKTEGRVVFLRPEEIAWVGAANNYAVLHLVDQRSLTMRETLGALEERLGEVGFARINRSTIVRLDEVKELHLHTAAHGDYSVVLRDGTRFSLSRHLRGWLEKLAPGKFH